MAPRLAARVRPSVRNSKWSFLNSRSEAKVSRLHRWATRLSARCTEAAASRIRDAGMTVSIPRHPRLDTDSSRTSLASPGRESSCAVGNRCGPRSLRDSPQPVRRERKGEVAAHARLEERRSGPDRSPAPPLADAPESALAHHLLGTAYLQCGATLRALRHLRLVASLAGEDVMYADTARDAQLVSLVCTRHERLQNLRCSCCS
jgi:hypothetical protein